MTANNVGHVGRETEATALGKRWRFSRWDRSVWVAFAEWAKAKLPCPIEAMSRSIDKVALKDAEVLRGLLEADQRRKAEHQQRLKACKSKEEQQALLPPVLMADQFLPISDQLAQKALDKASCHVSFSSPELHSLMSNPIGSGYIVYLLLQKHHPGVTEDEAFDVSMALGQGGELERVFAATQGQSEEAGEKNA